METSRSARVAVLAIAALPCIAHLATAANYGIFRDEYYYLACARRLAWGYVDHPPLSIAVLAAVRGVLGEGILALRLIPALCASVVVVIAARLAARLGGGGFAQVLAAVGMATVAVVQAITGFFSMNALDIVFWAAAWLLLAEWLVRREPRIVIGLGLLLGLGLMNKIGLFVLGAALVPALLLTPRRRLLLTPAPYVGAALALAMFAPHVVWQIAHGWPTLEFIANAQRLKIVAMPVHTFLAEMVLEQQPANLVLWTAGLGWLLFARRAEPFRALGLAFLFGLALLMLQRAKPYYAAGLFPPLLAAGACAWESFTASGRRWLRPVVLGFLAAAGIFFLPLAMPVLPVETFARWQAWTGIKPAAAEVGHGSELPQHYSDRFGWEELAAAVGRAAGQLEPGERARVVIIAQNYGQAGALEYWRDRYDLPPVVSGHNNYWLWSPAELDLGVIIAVGYDEEDVRESFDEVVAAGRLEQPWALENGTEIWIARRPKFSWTELREHIRLFI